MILIGFDSNMEIDAHYVGCGSKDAPIRIDNPCLKIPLQGFGRVHRPGVDIIDGPVDASPTPRRSTTPWIRTTFMPAGLLVTLGLPGKAPKKVVLPQPPAGRPLRRMLNSTHDRGNGRQPIRRPGDASPHELLYQLRPAIMRDAVDPGRPRMPNSAVIKALPDGMATAFELQSSGREEDGSCGEDPLLPTPSSGRYPAVITSLLLRTQRMPQAPGSCLDIARPRCNRAC